MKRHRSQCPARRLASLRIGPAQDVGDQRGLLAVNQHLGPSPVGTVDQTCQCLGVEANNGIAQRLALKAGRPRRLRPSKALAIASMRCAVLRRGSFLASRRNSAGLATSALTAKPRPAIAASQPRQNEMTSRSARKRPSSPLQSVRSNTPHLRMLQTLPSRSTHANLSNLTHPLSDMINLADSGSASQPVEAGMSLDAVKSFVDRARNDEEIIAEVRKIRTTNKSEALTDTAAIVKNMALNVLQMKYKRQYYSKSPKASWGAAAEAIRDISAISDELELP